MSEYTPTTGEILTAVVVYRALSGKSTPPPRVESLATSEDVAEYVDEFERWLSTHNAEIRAGAVAEGAEQSPEGVVRRLKESGVGAYSILSAVTKVYEMGMKA